MAHGPLSATNSNGRASFGLVSRFLRSWLAAGLLLAIGYLFAGSGNPAAPLLAMATGCNIKGNVSIGTGERIYHLPGQNFYPQTVISPKYGERWFCSKSQAREAGWRQSKRRVEQNSAIAAPNSQDQIKSIRHRIVRIDILDAQGEADISLAAEIAFYETVVLASTCWNFNSPTLCENAASPMKLNGSSSSVAQFASMTWRFMTSPGPRSLMVTPFQPP